MLIAATAAAMLVTGRRAWLAWRLTEGMAVITLDALNDASPAGFTAALAEVFEHAPWVAARAAAARPFATVTALHAAMFAAVEAAPVGEQARFLCGHPELAGAAARRGTMAALSAEEQASSGLDGMDDAGFDAMNRDYRARFGIPFILCVRRHGRASLLRQFRHRLGGTPDGERAAALHEVFLITRLRLAALVDGPGMPAVNGRLSTHVLNATLARPGDGIAVALYSMDGGGSALLSEAVTNGDGRTDAPLLHGAPLRTGEYELRFQVAAHFARMGLPQSDPPFLDMVPVRFSISEPEGHYHVPLLISPGSYTTYRGS